MPKRIGNNWDRPGGARWGDSGWSALPRSNPPFSRFAGTSASIQRPGFGLLRLSWLKLQSIKHHPSGTTVCPENPFPHTASSCMYYKRSEPERPPAQRQGELEMQQVWATFASAPSQVVPTPFAFLWHEFHRGIVCWRHAQPSRRARGWMPHSRISANVYSPRC